MPVRIIPENIEKPLIDLMRAAGNFTRLLFDWGERSVRSVHRNFQEGGRPDKWEPSGKVRRGQGLKTLIDTGRLINSISYEISADGLDVFTNVEYAPILNFGGPEQDVEIQAGEGKVLPIMTDNGLIFRKRARIPAGAVPPRPFMLFQEEDLAYFEITLADHLEADYVG